MKTKPLKDRYTGWRVEKVQYEKIYICKGNGNNAIYLHKTGILSRFCGINNFFKSKEEADDHLYKWLIKNKIPLPSGLTKEFDEFITTDEMKL